jgi:hypothetical protein
LPPTLRRSRARFDQPWGSAERRRGWDAAGGTPSIGPRPAP